MTINDVNILVNIAVKIAIVVLLSILGYKFYIFITIKIEEIEKKKVENNKIELYSKIDPKLVKQELINLIRDYTARYMTKSIMVNHIDFIKNDQMDEMVKSIVKDVMLEMSDMYLVYCKLLYNINNEDDLLKVIYHLTVDVVLDVVTEFNKTKQ